MLYLLFFTVFVVSFLLFVIRSLLLLSDFVLSYVAYCFFPFIYDWSLCLKLVICSFWVFLLYLLLAVCCLMFIVYNLLWSLFWLCSFLVFCLFSFVGCCFWFIIWCFLFVGICLLTTDCCMIFTFIFRFFCLVFFWFFLVIVCLFSLLDITSRLLFIFCFVWLSVNCLFFLVCYFPLNLCILFVAISSSFFYFFMVVLCRFMFVSCQSLIVGTWLWILTGKSLS